MKFGNIEVLVMRVSYSGELAYELHVANEHLIFIYNLIKQIGSKYDMVQFGLYATESMRLEKGYLHWKAELIYERNPLEAGLEQFTKWRNPISLARMPSKRNHDADTDNVLS